MSELTPYRRNHELSLPIWQDKHVCVKCVHHRAGQNGKPICYVSEVTTKFNPVTGEVTKLYTHCEYLNKKAECPCFTTPQGHLILRPMSWEEVTEGSSRLWATLQWWYYCWYPLPEQHLPPRTSHP